MKSKYDDLHIYTDGASRGNPGHASFGYVIMTPDRKVIAEHGEYIGVATNNQAEYGAIVDALDKASKYTEGTLHFFMDSELAVRQLTGIYKVKDLKIAERVKEIFRLSKRFENITYTHIVRDKNKHADALANDALDKHLKG